MSSNYVTVSRRPGEYRSIPFRYVWPAELDLMAQLAGMRLRERWAGWTRAPFTSESEQHVSVWEKPCPPGRLGLRGGGDWRRLHRAALPLTGGGRVVGTVPP